MAIDIEVTAAAIHRGRVRSPYRRRRRVHALFVMRLRERVIVRSAGSIHLPPDSAPEPDVVVLRRRDDFYRTVRTLPDDVLLAVEVAETSLRYDHRVEVYRAPPPDGYRTVERMPEAFPDLNLSISDILG